MPSISSLTDAVHRSGVLGVGAYLHIHKDTMGTEARFKMENVLFIYFMEVYSYIFGVYQGAATSSVQLSGF